MREYRKTATVFAEFPVGEQDVRVETLEGPAVARPGEHVILTANTPRGERWVIDREVFERTYEPVES